MDFNLIEEKRRESELRINMMWKAMVSGFQAIDPTLAMRWGARQPAGFVGKQSGNPGLSMYCDKAKLSIVVEYNANTLTYLISYEHDESKIVEPLTTVLSLDEIAPAIIQFLGK